VVGGQTGAKPTAFTRVTARKGRAYGRTFLLRIKQNTKWGQMNIPSTKLIKLNQF
jgi:hypothetical protein